MISIKIAGKDLKLRFGMHLYDKLMKRGQKSSEFGDIEFMAFIVYYGHENYCLGKDEVVKCTHGEVFMYIEDNLDSIEFNNEFKKVIEAYAESKPAQLINEAGNPDAAKKKSALTKSESSPLVS